MAQAAYKSRGKTMPGGRNYGRNQEGLSWLSCQKYPLIYLGLLL